MSGHSKWHNIQATKGKADAARGKIFTKIGREIAVAVKTGGADIGTNPSLRSVIEKAKANNMPKDNIERSIKKASGELGSINYESIVYEGYGVAGVAVIVEALTDNKNRTASEVRHIFDKCGGSLGTTGCVSYMFERKGVLVIEKQTGQDDDEMMMLAIDAGGEDFEVKDDCYEIITEADKFAEVRDNLLAQNIKFAQAELSRIPVNDAVLAGDNIAKFERMYDLLNDNDDLQNIYHNAVIEE